MSNKIRGDTQIMPGTIPETALEPGFKLPTEKLVDGDELLRRDGSVPHTGNQSMGDHRLTDVDDPQSPQDAVNLRTLEEAIAQVGGGTSSGGASFFQSRENGHTQPLLVGQPVCIIDNKFYPAKCVAPYNKVVGLVYDQDIAPGDVGQCQISGVMTNPHLVWDAGLPTVGGLVPEAFYYLDANGMLSLVSPDTVGQYVVPIGVALSSSSLELRLTNFQVKL